jgi:hypothetical protein
MRPLVINYARTEYIRDLMVQNGDAHKPIWISEMNSNAPPGGPAAQGITGYGSYGVVSLETQAEWAALAYERAQREWPFVGVVNFWFFKPASDADVNQAYYYFRMLEPDFTPLPVYDAVKAYANQRPRMYTGTHQEDHWAVVWTGDWSDYGSEAAMLGGYRLAGEDAAAQVCVGGDELEVVRVPGINEEAHLLIEQDRDCLTVHAAPGVAIDAFVVKNGTHRLPISPVLLLLAFVLGGWGLSLWLRRTR